MKMIDELLIQEIHDLCDRIENGEIKLEIRCSILWQAIYIIRGDYD